MRSGEILRVMLWQHKLKKREAEGYCADAFKLMIIWIGTPKTFIDIKDDQRDQ